MKNWEIVFLPKQNRSTDWETSLVIQPFLSGCLIFLWSFSFKTNGRENSNVHIFLPDLHKYPSMFFWILWTLQYVNVSTTDPRPLSIWNAWLPWWCLYNLGQETLLYRLFFVRVIPFFHQQTQNITADCWEIYLRH